MRFHSDSSTASYFVQIRSVERRLLRLALESGEGDLEIAAGLLGLERGFFIERAKLLGGVLKNTVINEPPVGLEVASDGRVVGAVDPKAAREGTAREGTAREEAAQEEAALEETKKADKEPDDPPAVPVLDALKSAKERLRAGLIKNGILTAKEDQAGAEPRPGSGMEGAQRLAPGADATEEGSEDAPSDDDEPKRKPGRPVAVSPNADFLTAREAEQLLGISSAGLNYMKNRGEITAVFDDNARLWLYPRAQIEQIAAERSKKKASQ